MEHMFFYLGRITDKIFYEVSDRSVRTERTQAESSGKLHERAKVFLLLLLICEIKNSYFSFVVD